MRKIILHKIGDTVTFVASNGDRGTGPIEAVTPEGPFDLRVQDHPYLPAYPVYVREITG